MSDAKTTAEHTQQAQERTALGLTRLVLHAHPADHDLLKRVATGLQIQRRRAAEMNKLGPD